jgi:tetratricopeptide (TPR) repeat protein
VRVRVAAGHLLAAVEQMEESRRQLDEAKTIAGDDQQLLKPALLAEVELATRKGDFKRAWERLDVLHRIVKTKSNEPERHRVALNLAQARAALGDRGTALESLEEAEQLLPDDAAAAVERTRVRALVDHFTRDFRSAALHCEKAIEMGRELGLTYEVMVNLHNLGATLVYLDDLPRAYGAFQQSLALCEESSYERLANYNRMFLAFLDGLQGTADGPRLLDQGVAYAESKDFTWDVIGGRALLAKLLHRRGDTDEARLAYEKARALAVGAGHSLIADDCDQALMALQGSPACSASAS